jgi:hypothetical protein
MTFLSSPTVTNHDPVSYVPILLCRSGELWALSSAGTRTWSSVRPLVQLELKLRNGLQVRTQPAVQRLADAVRDRPIYLDVLSPRDRPSDLTSADLARIHDEAREAGILFIPVQTVGMRRPRAALSASAANDGRGLALRWRLLEPQPRTRSRRETLLGELDLLDASAEDVDLILDLGHWPEDAFLPASQITRALHEISGLPWSSITLAGTSIPRTLAAFAADDITAVPRREWGLWQEVVRTAGPGLRFGDYGVQHPRSPFAGRGGRMWANIRYSLERGTLVARGTRALADLEDEERPAQYRNLCNLLVADPRFAGRECCPGDAVIEDCARGIIPPGTQGMWRGAGTSHHLEVTAMNVESTVEAARRSVAVSRQADRRSRVAMTLQDGLAP